MFDRTSSLPTALNPHQFEDVPEPMAAFIGYVLDTRFTDPAIHDLMVTREGCVMVRLGSTLGSYQQLGSLIDLQRAWRKLLTAADLSPGERAEAEAAFAMRVSGATQPLAVAA